MNEHELRSLLDEADRTAPVPPVAPVSLASLRRRLLRRRLCAAALALLIFGAGFQLLRTVETLGRTVGPAPLSVAALRAEVDRLLAAVTELAEDAPPRDDTATAVALERSAMTSLSYADRLHAIGDPDATRRFARIARIWAGTQAAQQAEQRMPTTSRTEPRNRR